MPPGSRRAGNWKHGTELLPNSTSRKNAAFRSWTRSMPKRQSWNRKKRCWRGREPLSASSYQILLNWQLSWSPQKRHWLKPKRNWMNTPGWKIRSRPDASDRRNCGAENTSLKAEMDDLKLRIEKLEAADGATCPLCGQPLSAEHRQSTLEQLQVDGKQKVIPGGRTSQRRKNSPPSLRITMRKSQIMPEPAPTGSALSNTVAQLTERLETMPKADQGMGDQRGQAPGTGQ